MKLSDKFKIIIPPQDIACNPQRLEKLADGDREAYAWVYKNYCQKIYDYAFLMTNNEQVSEDIVQEVFLRLWMKRERLRGIENFAGYLNIMCRNYIISLFRNEKREMERKGKYLACVSKTYHAVDEIIHFRETQRLIANAIKDLPTKQHQVLALREIGMKRPQMAKLLGISEFTVKGHVNRGIRFFKERLGLEL